MQEVLRFTSDEQRLCATYIVAQSVPSRHLGRWWPQRLALGGITKVDHRYVPGGRDQVALLAQGERTVERMLASPAVQAAAK